MTTATATANPNIAFIKYWGNRDEALRLPSNGSISMNLEGLVTHTSVSFNSALTEDQLSLNGRQVSGAGLARVEVVLNRVRELSGLHLYASVNSENNFPTGAGIASSASAFAALSLAASRAAGLALEEKDLSRLARLGSGSASRSVPGGYVEWQAGKSDADSFAFSIAGPGHWALTDCVAIVSQRHKSTGSSDGHTSAASSPLQAARLQNAANQLDLCRRAILERDFEALARVTELDSNLMHAIIMTSDPPILYWEPATLRVMQAVRSWRKQGLPVFYTIDAGPNVHVLCPSQQAEMVKMRLLGLEGVKDVLAAGPGGPACVLDEDSQ